VSFDKLRKRENLGGTKNRPHPELVEGRTTLLPVFYASTADQNVTGTTGASPFSIKSGILGEAFSQTSSIERLGE
jgi:hypothetical protein